MSDYSETFYLFAKPSFLEGMSRVFDFGCTLREYNEHPTPKQADAEALRRDWRVTGKDIEFGIQEYERTSKHGGQ